MTTTSPTLPPHPASTLPAGPTVELVDSSSLLGQPEALRAGGEELGYLFFRGLLPRDEVLSLRHDILEVVGAHGWLVDGTDVDEGVADVAAFDRVPPAEAAFCGSGIPIDAYRDVQRLRSLHALAHTSVLRSLFGDVLDEPVLRLPLTIARVMVPSTGAIPTPPHQDFIHVQGSPRTWTAWFPLGDCPVTLGGLSVQIGSHHEGLLTYRPAAGAGEIEAQICNTGLQWAGTDYAAGDVLTFPSHTVHRSLPNQAGERVRLSCDVRFQPVSDPIATNSLQVHCDVLPWDEIYAGWDTDPAHDDLRHYWDPERLQVVAWDETFRWQKHRIC